MEDNNNISVSSDVQPFAIDEPKVSDTESYTYNYSQSNLLHLAGPNEQTVIDYSSVKRIKEFCEKAKKKTIPWAELCLGVASLLFGAALSAWISGVKYELAFKPILFYTICPVVGAATAVAWFFIRNSETVDSAKLAEKIEEYLPKIDYNKKGE